jgi:alkylation response protein AidB-like acyl-CoA dehydrogenase
MLFDVLASPTAFLKHMLPTVPAEGTLADYEAWWEGEGKAISFAVDQGGTPHVRLFDVFGRRVDEILYPPDYWRMLRVGYNAGSVWRAFEEARSLIPSYALGYLTCFYDVGLNCPYTVSLSTAVPLEKYGDAALKGRFLDPLLRRDDSVWQGATWMTEARGGSDLGATVETIARPVDDGWRLTGDKYFCSNAGAEVAVVAARLENGLPGVRGLGLFLLPRYREDGTLNYHLRRLKDKIATRSVPTGEIELRDSQAYLLGKPEWGIYLILEVLNLSRVSNAMGSMALAQRAMADALAFAKGRIAFGKPLIEQPLMCRQFEEKLLALEEAFALAWESAQMMDEMRYQTPPYQDRFHLFRLIVHLAKYWTAELAVQSAKWAMEVNGGMGTLAEFGVERWLREAMIVDIWEGPPHRQILDGLEVMERKGAHEMLFEVLTPYADGKALQAVEARIADHLKLRGAEKEAAAQGMFEALAHFTAQALLKKMQSRR